MIVTRKLKPDYRLLTIILTMLAVGLLILYSASTVVSYSKFQSNTSYFIHQLLYGAIPGLVALYICSKIDYHKWQKLAPFIIIASILALAAVLIPGMGYEVGNARRWLLIGPVSLQVAEFAKLGLIIYIASWLDKRSAEIKNFSTGLIPLLVMIAVVLGLIFFEPDIGTMIVVGLIAITMLFVGGSQIKHLMWVVGGALAALVVIVKMEPYRVARFTTFLNPSVDPTGIGYQINQALLAIGAGGFFGYGYGQSRQKYNYLPEVMGDSIFAITAEELGFLRAGLIIVLYLAFTLRALKIAKHAPDMFGRMLAIGIAAWVSFQAIINIGAISGVLPLTGVPLPLVSYGSSALIATLAALGILLNVSKQSKIYG